MKPPVSARAHTCNKERVLVIGGEGAALRSGLLSIKPTFFNPKGHPMKPEQDSIESEILAKALTAPRVTHARIDEVVVSEDFYVFPGTTLTVCCLTLKNGFTVVGESACASADNFDAELGRCIARINAKEKIWALEGYALRNALMQS
jgi:hypothetical protein